MHFDVFTLFPGMFAGPLDESIIKRAREAGLLELSIHNLRDFAHDRHKTVDDRPFGGGDLFSRVRTKPVPDWAKEFDCESWAQFFLKWIIAHPAATCAIPATNNPRHLEDNMRAGIGRLPTEEMRRRMTEFLRNI